MRRALLALSALSWLGVSVAGPPGPAVAAPPPSHAPGAVLPGPACGRAPLAGTPVAGPARALPVGALQECPGIRPGGIVRHDRSMCTTNFLFTGSDGHRYIGTAGHCVLGGGVGGTPAPEPELAWALGQGPRADDVAQERIGEFAYAIRDFPNDFALVRLDPGLPASPEMCHFGGPTGGYDSDLEATTEVVHFYGNGQGVGAATPVRNVVPARSAVALSTEDPNHVYALGMALPGDSGGGVISDDGRALGVVITIGPHVASLSPAHLDVGTVGISRIEPRVRRAEEVLGIRLTLETAPLR